MIIKEIIKKDGAEIGFVIYKKCGEYINIYNMHIDGFHRGGGYGSSWVLDQQKIYKYFVISGCINNNFWSKFGKLEYIQVADMVLTW